MVLTAAAASTASGSVSGSVGSVMAAFQGKTTQSLVSHSQLSGSAKPPRCGRAL